MKLLVVLILIWLGFGCATIGQANKNPNCSTTPPCIRKCCSSGEYAQRRIYNNGSGKQLEIVCIKNSSRLRANSWRWSPKIYSDPNTASENGSISFPYEIQKLSCGWQDELRYFGSNKFRLLENGHTIVNGEAFSDHDDEDDDDDIHDPIVWFTLDASMFCLDQLYDQRGQKLAADVMFLCSKAYDDQLENIQKQLQTYLYETFGSAAQTNGIISITSSIFLALALCIYLLLWNTHNIHGWTQFSFLLACFCTYFIAGTRRLIGYEVLIEWNLGTFFEALEDFGAVSTSANLVALSFDLLFTLWKSKPTFSKRDGRGRFLLITASAWLTGIIVMIIGLVVKSQDHHGYPIQLSKLQHFTKYIPKLLEFFLCIQNDMLFTVCLPAVQLGLFSINLILFVVSVTVLVQKTQESRLVFENIAKKQIIQLWIRRYVKLFIIMGLWWPVIVLCMYDCVEMKAYTVVMWTRILATYYRRPDLRQSSGPDSDEVFKIPWHMYIISNVLAVHAIVISILFVYNNKKITNELRKCVRLKVRRWKMALSMGGI